jgi:hypothetical protein
MNYYGPVLFYLNRSAASSHSLVLSTHSLNTLTHLFALLCFHFVPCHHDLTTASTASNGIHSRLPVRRFSVIVVIPIASPISPQVDREEDLGDFNDNANPLWSLYANKAENHDKAKIKTVTENMTDILLFVRSHAPTLTACLIMTAYLGWLVCCCPHPFHCRSCSDHTSNSCTADGILREPIC